MDLAGVQRLTCSLPAVSRLHPLTHNSTPNHAAIIFSSGGLVRLGPAQVQRFSDGTLTQTVLAPASTTSPERSEATHPSRPCGRLLCPRLALLLNLVLLQWGEQFSETSEGQAAVSSVISTQPIKEGVMKRRRILAVSVGTLVLGGLLLASGGPGVTPAGAQNPTRSSSSFGRFRTSSIRSWRPLRAAVEVKSGEGNEITLRWDQVLPAAQRFVILPAFNSDAVLDKETGLVWEKSPQTTAVSSSNVRLTCANKAVGGRKGWRLPSLPELASLVDPSVASPGPTLSAGHPFLNVQSSNYWSASAHAENPTLMWGVGFGNGTVLGLSKAFDQRAWCVRGGMNAD